jgi:hypothetical protein
MVYSYPEKYTTIDWIIISRHRFGYIQIPGGTIVTTERKISQVYSICKPILSLCMEGSKQSPLISSSTKSGVTGGVLPSRQGPTLSKHKRPSRHGLCLQGDGIPGTWVSYYLKTVLPLQLFAFSYAHIYLFISAYL